MSAKCVSLSKRYTVPIVLMAMSLMAFGSFSYGKVKGRVDALDVIEGINLDPAAQAYYAQSKLKTIVVAYVSPEAVIDGEGWAPDWKTNLNGTWPKGQRINVINIDSRSGDEYDRGIICINYRGIRHDRRCFGVMGIGEAL